MSAAARSLPAMAAPAISGRSEYVLRLGEILAALEADDAELFEQRLGQLIRLREEGLFVSLARLTRELHQAVRELNVDERLRELAGNEIPDARQRLDYVVQLGERAAHRTLDLADGSRELLLRLAQAAADFERINAQLPAYGVPAPISVALTQVQAVILGVGSELRSNVSAISQAQEFQDLSGQVIRRVITLVHNIEGALVTLLRLTSEGAMPAVVKIQPGASGELCGPAVPGLAEGAASQQDADALLAELGF
jgi:chemotaxis protein CheZ